MPGENPSPYMPLLAGSVERAIAQLVAARDANPVRGRVAESFDEVRRVYFFGRAVGGSSPLSRRCIAAEL